MPDCILLVTYCFKGFLFFKWQLVSFSNAPLATSSFSYPLIHIISNQLELVCIFNITNLGIRIQHGINIVKYVVKFKLIL